MKHVTSNDLSIENAMRRQSLAAIWLAKADLEAGILSRPCPTLDTRFCQLRARHTRKLQQVRSELRLRQAAKLGARLYAVHLVHPGWILDVPLSEARAADIRSFFATKLRDHPGFMGLEACIEPDFCSGLNQPQLWRQTVHGVIAVGPGLDAEESLRTTLLVQNQTGIRKPLDIKPITDLRGALRYCYKGLAIDAVTERATYQGARPDGSPRIRSRTVRLKPAQQIALVRNLADVGLSDRFFRVKPAVSEEL